MAETADKALDLADKWAQQIGQKLSEAAPGAADIAREAVVVKIVSELVSWTACLIGFIILMLIVRYCIAKFLGLKIPGTKDDYEPQAIPFLIVSVCGGFFAFGLFIALFATFPSKEIAGVFAPRGYVALMMLDAVSGQKK